MTEPGAAELLEVEVPVGGRVLVVSDLHLAGEVTIASVAATIEIAQAIDAWTGPGVLVFNGSCLELLVPNTDVRATLTAHRKLVATVSAFAAGPGRRVLYLPGARDGRAAWDAKVVSALRDVIGAEVALAAELLIHTGAGLRRVQVEPGHRLDPLTRPGDPRNPADSPLGQHLVCEVLPALGSGSGTGSAVSGDGWLAGLDALDDPGSFPRFLASRLTYRRLGRHARWLLAPLIAAVLLRLPLAIVRRAHSHVASASRLAVYLVLATMVELLLIGGVVAAVIRGTWRALAGVALSRAGGPDDPNAAPRALARDLVTAGHAGLITGHTRHPELTHLGHGFYANTGCACQVVSESPARLDALGMPSLFLAHRQVAWVELEAGNELHVRLLHARRDLPGATVIERILTRRDPESRPHGEVAPVMSFRSSGSAGRSGGDIQPQVVATFPQGGSWPEEVDIAYRQRRVRRWAAGLVALAGILSLVSAFSAPLRQRLADVLQFVPLLVPQAANALVAVAGLAMLVLARSVRRGQRRAWLICEGLLAGTFILHLVKGVDVEEALVAAGVAAFLFINRDAFCAGVDRPSTRRGITTLAGGAAVAVVTGTIGVEIGTMLSRSRHHQRLPLPRAFTAAAERMVGVQTVSVPDRLNDFLAPAMLAVAICLVLAACYLLLRPVVARRAVLLGSGSFGSSTGGPMSGVDGLTRARAVVRRHGSGTLDYFALRTDKQWFFWGDSLVAYGVYGGVCLVSPDPIGPVSEREETWKEFRRFADQQGWALAVMAAGEKWLPVYRASGMHDLYVGDEAVVDCTRFTLDGGRYKGLRQAVNRIAKYRYTITFHDPATIDDELRAQLGSVMTKSRRGDVERGFSMTLGRAFDPSDDGLLLAVVWSPPPAPAVEVAGSTDGAEGAGAGRGEPVAFCQYVPAPGIEGFSLDLMRRDDGEHPNGLLDFVVVETIRYLKAHGHRGLGLNFATMRAVLAGEAGEGMSQRIQAWLLRRMSDSMQIESLWRFNAKYDPDWQPRYALYDSPENGLPAAIAVARAESFWELPVIGRFLVPNGPHGAGAAVEPAAPAAVSQGPSPPAGSG